MARAVIEGVSLSFSSFMEALRYEALAPAIAALMGDALPGSSGGAPTGTGDTSTGGTGGRADRAPPPNASGSLASLEASLKTSLALVPGPSPRPQSSAPNIPTMSSSGRGFDRSSVASDGARALSMTSDTAR